MSTAFPVLLLVQYIAASLFYAWDGDWRHSIYWGAAAMINAVVTF